MAATPRKLTVQEYLEYDDDAGSRYELVDRDLGLVGMEPIPSAFSMAV